MALILPPRVVETTTTTGTGTLTLAGAVTGFQSFSAVGDGNTCQFVVEAVDANGVPTGPWEENTGTYTLSGTTLSRGATPIGSSNAGALVDFAAGTKRVKVVRASAGQFAVPKVGSAVETNGFLVDPSTGSLTYYSNNFTNLNLFASAEMFFGPSESKRFRLNTANLLLGKDIYLGWGENASPDGSTFDSGFSRIGAGVVGVKGTTAGAGATLEFTEVTAPAAGAADTARLYAEDNGAGKTRLVIKWSDGTTAVLATQA